MKRSHLRSAAALLLAVLVFLSLAGCGRVERQSKTWYTWFDTVTTLTGYGTREEFQRACALVEETLDTYHRLCDIYHEYSGMNNVRSVNLAAGRRAVPVAAELREVLAFGREVYERTDGMCNIAMGAVLSLWHECRETALDGGEAALPSADALRAAAAHCDIDDMVIDDAAGTVYLSDGAMSLDLGAIAKGCAAERAARRLEEAGFDPCSFALSVGGNVRVMDGKADGSNWIAGIQDPDESSESAYLLRLELPYRLSLVTSGSYQRFYEVDGVRYHHIISPETLYPRNEFLSVSILTKDSGWADALSTAVFNMTLEDGLNYVNRSGFAAACWILADGEMVFSDEFEAYILP